MNSFTELPPDNFGLHVENEIDRLKLLWIVNSIGESRLRASASKRNKYYPDSPLFVSVIIKRLRLRVPTQIYAPVNVPIFRIYVLVLRDRSCVKIGMTGRWPQRAYDFVKSADYFKCVDIKTAELFDANLSIAFSAENETDARQTESALQNHFSAFSVTSPFDRGLIPWGCGGHTEWFQFSIYDQLISALNANRQSYTLNAAIQWDILDTPL